VGVGSGKRLWRGDHVCGLWGKRAGFDEVGDEASTSRMRRGEWRPGKDCERGERKSDGEHCEGEKKRDGK